MCAAVAAVQALRLLAGPAMRAAVEWALAEEDGALRRALGQLLPHLEPGVQRELRATLGIKAARDADGPDDFDAAFEEAGSNGAGAGGAGRHVVSDYFSGRGDLELMAALRDRDEGGSGVGGSAADVEAGAGGDPTAAMLAELMEREAAAAEERSGRVADEELEVSVSHDD